MYLIGVDGGGTKTHCVIGDLNGKILSEGISGPSNYQVVGQDIAKKSIYESIELALSKLNISLEDIKYAVLGLSGADEKEDLIILNKICKEIFNDIPFKVLHDGWIAFRAGTNAESGIVSICGTGHGAAGISKDGRKVQLRNMYYRLGNSGGGAEIINKALYYAFRSEEGTFSYTKLEKEIPKVFACSTMADVDPIIRNNKYYDEQLNEIPIIVSRLAREQDEVSQKILIDMGRDIGEFSSGLIKKLKLENEEIPIVVAGSVFTGDNPLFVTSYLLEVQKTAPYAKIIILNKAPAMGAYYLAKDYYINIKN